MRPRLEVADIVRRHGAAFCRSKGDRLSRSQRRVLGAIDACRTAALGGHAERCVDCGVIRCAYNSCLMGKIRNGELATVETLVLVYLNRISSKPPPFLSP